jgi:hypothetical protein
MTERQSLTGANTIARQFIVVAFATGNISKAVSLDSKLGAVA